jgi:hypothetical protein
MAAAASLTDLKNTLPQPSVPQSVVLEISEAAGLALARLGANISKASVLTEKGETPKDFGDMPNQHDILTGSRPDGTRLSRCRRSHLQLDIEQHRVGATGTLRQHGRRQCFLEFGSPLTRLQPGKPGLHRRRRIALLLRD